VSELVPPKTRGILVDIHAVSLNAAYLVAAYVGVGFYFYTGSSAWRGPLGLQMLFPFIGLVGIWSMPESPRFLIAKGRIEEAWAVVHRLHSDPSDPTDSFAKREFYQMRKQIELDATLPSDYLHIFRTPSLRWRAFITMFLTFSLMSCGVLVINS
jgi:MFS family permease